MDVQVSLEAFLTDDRRRDCQRLLGPHLGAIGALCKAALHGSRRRGVRRDPPFFGTRFFQPILDGATS